MKRCWKFEDLRTKFNSTVIILKVQLAQMKEDLRIEIKEAEEMKKENDVIKSRWTRKIGS